MPKYREAGVAFEGDTWDITFTSKDVFIDVLLKSINTLCGNADPKKLGVSIMWINGTKVVVEGLGRLYLIEEII